MTMNTFGDLASTTTGLILDHARGLAGMVLAVALVIGAHTMLHHAVATQAAEAAALDRLTQPLQANAPPAPAPEQWIPLQ